MEFIFNQFKIEVFYYDFYRCGLVVLVLDTWVSRSRLDSSDMYLASVVLYSESDKGWIIFISCVFSSSADYLRSCCFELLDSDSTFLETDWGCFWENFYFYRCNVIGSSIDVYIGFSCLEGCYFESVFFLVVPVKKAFVAEVDDSRGWYFPVVSFLVFVEVAFTFYSLWDFKSEYAWWDWGDFDSKYMSKVASDSWFGVHGEFSRH